MLPFKRLKEKCRIFFGGDIIPLRELQLPYITRCNKNLDKNFLWISRMLETIHVVVTVSKLLFDSDFFFLHPLNYPKVHDYRLRSITGIGLDHKQLTLV